jgi:hypothetical protein
MNFFGHAAIAGLRTDNAAIVLGAMLPDLASMIGARPPRVSHSDLRQGVDLHHRTDEIFHDSAAFRQLSARSFALLMQRGLSRGSARATAHVGIEIQIDAELAVDARARQAYMAALAAARVVEAGIVWSADERKHFATLCHTLRSRGVSPRHADPPVLARRIERTLAGRPRLALVAADLDAIAAWAAELRPRVAMRMPELRADLARIK